MFAADYSIGEIVAAVSTVLGAIGTALYTVIKLFLSHLSNREEKQQKHETDIMTRMERMITQVEQLGNRFDASVKEARQENRQTIDTLLKIQKETVESISDLGNQVTGLSTAINELRVDMRVIKGEN